MTLSIRRKLNQYKAPYLTALSLQLDRRRASTCTCFTMSLGKYLHAGLDGVAHTDRTHDR